MTTKELLEKAKYYADGLPIILLGYIIKDKNNVIQLGNNVPISFRDEDETIKKIEEAEKLDGFMFWNISTEGEIFFTVNGEAIATYLTNSILNQR